MEGIKNKTLADRLNRYTDYRRMANKGSESFADYLIRKVGHTGRTKESKGEDRHKIQTLRASRRFQPPHFAKPKAITQTQAQRLAHYAPAIEGSARKYGVPVELICGVILQESGGNPRAVSPAKAMGLMQLIPSTAKRFGCRNPFDPVQNIDAGTRYLRFLIDRFKGDISLALAGYNAGEHNVEKFGNKIPPFRETRNYVPNVLGYTQTMINIFAAKQEPMNIPLNNRRA